MKILRLFAVLTAMTALMLCACSQKNTDNNSTVQSVGAEVILSRVSKSGQAEVLDEQLLKGESEFDENCEKLFGVTAQEISDGGIMFVSSGSGADEISVLKCENAEELLERRRQQRYSDFEGYAPDELEKIENAVIFEYEGEYILIISDNAESLKNLVINEEKEPK